MTMMYKLHVTRYDLMELLYASVTPIPELLYVSPLLHVNRTAEREKGRPENRVYHFPGWNMRRGSVRDVFCDCT